MPPKTKTATAEIEQDQTTTIEQPQPPQQQQPDDVTEFLCSLAPDTGYRAQIHRLTPGRTAPQCGPIIPLDDFDPGKIGAEYGTGEYYLTVRTQNGAYVKRVRFAAEAPIKPTDAKPAPLPTPAPGSSMIETLLVQMMNQNTALMTAIVQRPQPAPAPDKSDRLLGTLLPLIVNKGQQPKVSELVAELKALQELQGGNDLGDGFQQVMGLVAPILAAKGQQQPQAPQRRLTPVNVRTLPQTNGTTPQPQTAPQPPTVRIGNEINNREATPEEAAALTQAAAPVNASNGNEAIAALLFAYSQGNGSAEAYAEIIADAAGLAGMPIPREKHHIALWIGEQAKYGWGTNEEEKTALVEAIAQLANEEPEQEQPKQ